MGAEIESDPARGHPPRKFLKLSRSKYSIYMGPSQTRKGELVSQFSETKRFNSSRISEASCEFTIFRNGLRKPS